MPLHVGMVVQACAGKEKDGFYLIVDTDQKFVFLADGRHRTIRKPKRKNPRHVRPTQIIWNPDGMTDKALRQKLRLLKEGNKFVERRFD
ncbi:MAG: KOW domain-containing RNA-binding protein [Oscillospiraceae bacterium]|nr:KOW domain-containing RNA-binding protein [Oscillospiraceae bacterium]